MKLKYKYIIIVDPVAFFSGGAFSFLLFLSSGTALTKPPNFGWGVFYRLNFCRETRRKNEPALFFAVRGENAARHCLAYLIKTPGASIEAPGDILRQQE